MDQSTCIVDGCDATAYCKQMCRKHYNQDYYRRTLGAEIASRLDRERAEYIPPTEKACTRCGAVKGLDEFRANKRNQSTGRDAVCRSCRAGDYAANRDAIRAQVHARYLANRGTILARKREEYAANRDLHRVRNAEAHKRHREARAAAAAARRARPEYAAEARRRTTEWRKANPERARAAGASYRARFPERVANNLRRWHEANPEKVKLHRIRRRDKIRNAGRIEFTAEQLTARLAFFDFRCWMCGGPYEHLDHVKPLSKGGITALANLRPACRPCNLSKKDKWPGVAEVHLFVRQP